MSRTLRLLLVFFALTMSAAAQEVDFTFLQVNDVYEITPVAGGKQGGVARLAQLKDILQKRNWNTYMVLAGDVFSPSALGTAEVNGERLAGKQMVACMNAAGLDYATFGNHEFDVKEAQFHQRLAESQAKWFSGNVRDANGGLFPKTSENIILNVKSKNGKDSVRVALIGVTLNSNPQPWVTYLEPIETVRAQVAALKGKADVFVALTHLAIEDDIRLAEAVPELDLIMGGHEHENLQLFRGPDFTPIVKADANARTAYIHDLTWNTKTRKLKIDSRLRALDETIPQDPKVTAVVHQWVNAAYAGFKASGFEPAQLITTVGEPLDGREASVRNFPTALTDLIGDAMLREVPTAELAFYNGGSIRIDDVIPPGPVTQYDVIRVLPFGGKVFSVEMRGDLLKKVLDAGLANRGQGGFLQHANVELANGTWMINGKPLDAKKMYKTATSDFLMSGKERGIEFLTAKAPGVGKVEEKRDIRFAVIEELKAGSE